MMKGNSIYELENYLTDGKMVEKSTTRIMYDVRKMSEYIKKIGRPLTNAESKQFIVY